MQDRVRVSCSGRWQFEDGYYDGDDHTKYKDITTEASTAPRVNQVRRRSSYSTGFVGVREGQPLLLCTAQLSGSQAMPDLVHYSAATGGRRCGSW